MFALFIFCVECFGDYSDPIGGLGPNTKARIFGLKGEGNIFGAKVKILVLNSEAKTFCPNPKSNQTQYIGH